MNNALTTEIKIDREWVTALQEIVHKIDSSQKIKSALEEPAPRYERTLHIKMPPEIIELLQTINQKLDLLMKE